MKCIPNLFAPLSPLLFSCSGSDYGSDGGGRAGVRTRASRIALAYTKKTKTPKGQLFFRLSALIGENFLAVEHSVNYQTRPNLVITVKRIPPYQGRTGATCCAAHCSKFSSTHTGEKLAYFLPRCYNVCHKAFLFWIMVLWLLITPYPAAFKSVLPLLIF